jgi:alpha-1,3-rhamnosyl/mannosyltransferase
MRHRLPESYVLFGGGFDPRKNLLGALRGFAAAAPRLEPGLCLAVSGAPGGIEREARALVASSGLAARVHFLGFVPDDDFPALMTGATAFLFPSLFEGFGLPALEAMACGTAVIASSTTSLPEVCGDAALLVEPSDPAALARALERIANDAPLRQQLGRRGLERAASFTWQRTAAATLDLYDESVQAGAIAQTGSAAAAASAALSQPG